MARSTADLRLDSAGRMSLLAALGVGTSPGSISRNLVHMRKAYMPASTRPCRVWHCLAQGNISVRIRSLPDLLANVVFVSLVRLNKVEFSRAEEMGEGDRYSRAASCENSVSGMRTALREYDITVVRSGAGGGIAAYRHGLNLLLLEVGRTYDVRSEPTHRRMEHRHPIGHLAITMRPSGNRFPGSTSHARAPAQRPKFGRELKGR